MKEHAYRDLIPGIEDHKPNEAWTRDQIIAAASIYAENGSLRKTSRMTGIHLANLAIWNQSNEVWNDQVKQCQTLKNQEHIAGWSTIVGRSQDIALQGIESIEVKTANDVKAIVMAGAIAQDKGRLLQGLPSHISSTTDDNKLKDLQAKFEELAGKTIEGERVDD